MVWVAGQVEYCQPASGLSACVQYLRDQVARSGGQAARILQAPEAPLSRAFTSPSGFTSSATVAGGACCTLQHAAWCSAACTSKDGRCMLHGYQ
jgi:hypothetical protein